MASVLSPHVWDEPAVTAVNVPAGRIGLLVAVVAPAGDGGIGLEPTRVPRASGDGVGCGGGGGSGGRVVGLGVVVVGCGVDCGGGGAFAVGDVAYCVYVACYLVDALEEEYHWAEQQFDCLRCECLLVERYQACGGLNEGAPALLFGACGGVAAREALGDLIAEPMQLHDVVGADGYLEDGREQVDGHDRSVENRGRAVESAFHGHRRGVVEL